MANIPNVNDTSPRPVPMRSQNPLQRTDSRLLYKVITRAQTPPRNPSPIDVKYLPADAFIEETTHKVINTQEVKALTDGKEDIQREDTAQSLFLENGMVFD